MLAIRQAAGRIGSERLLDCDLYVTLEPCGWRSSSNDKPRPPLAALLLLAAPITEAKLGIDAERKSLESIADPLSSAAPQARKAI